jgi:hypothetical protein
MAISPMPGSEGRGWRSPVGVKLHAATIKSAHVYQTEFGYVRGVLAQSKRRALG